MKNLKASLTLLSLFWFFPILNVQAQGNYPAKPIRIIVPYSAGGETDILARLMAKSMSTTLGQTVFVENRPGSSGIIGNGIVAKSPADGYTLLLGSAGSIAVLPSLYQKLPYDPVNDFAPISLAVNIPFLVVASPTINVKTIKELIELARQNPDVLTYASSGKDLGHLSVAVFEHRAKIKLTHIPYGGNGPALVAVLGGDVDLMFDNLSAALPYVQAGKLRAIAVTSSQRTSLLPNVPTIAESGFPGYVANSWFGMLAPVGTPTLVIKQLNQAVHVALQDPEVLEKLRSRGITVSPDSPDEFARFIKAEIAKWGRVAQQIDLKEE
jgi:tripartite-type tricarboxylate transporter receptor subunit TctC